MRDFVVTIHGIEAYYRARDRSRAKYLAARDYTDAFGGRLGDVFAEARITVSETCLTVGDPLCYPRRGAEGPIFRR